MFANPTQITAITAEVPRSGTLHTIFHIPSCWGAAIPRDHRMEIKVNFLDKLRLEAKFDDFTVLADQPIRYKGDGSAPGPFDYFLASSALCAAYFVKLYCETRGISTEHIRLSQNNIVDPENRYLQTIKIQAK